MGPLLVFVSPCFRKNEIVTCKIGSFFMSLDNLFHKNVIDLFFFFGIQFQNGYHLKKKQTNKKTTTILTYFSNVLVTRESYKNSFSKHLTHIHTCILISLLRVFCFSFLFLFFCFCFRFCFCFLFVCLFAILLYQFWKKIRIYQVGPWFLSDVIAGVNSYSRHLAEQSINNKMVSKLLKLECLLQICIYTYPKFTVTCKPRTLSDGR